MEPVTLQELENIARRINHMLGTPVDAYTSTSDGYRTSWKSNVGHHHIEHSGFGYSLLRMSNEGGAATTVIPSGTRRELRDRMQSFIEGIYAARENATRSSR
jgi:hypothetical protein